MTPQERKVMELALKAIESEGWCDTEPVITAIKEVLAQLAVTESHKQEPCPDKERDEYTCKNRHQCWEPCGELGKSEEHVRVAQPEQEPVAWVPYLSDRADGVKGHYAIARWNPRGYREVWNLRRHEWGAYSDDVLSLEEADTLLRLITIPTRKVTSPQPPQRKPLTEEEMEKIATEYWLYPRKFVRAIEAAHGIKE